MNPAAPPADDPAVRRRLNRWAVAAALIAVLTFLHHATPAGVGAALGPADLGSEANLASWFSAASLWWAGLLTLSAAVALRRRDTPTAAACGFLGVVALLLGVDEAGSLHERFDLLVPASLGLSLPRVAALGALPVLASVWVLFRRREHCGPVWAWLLGACALFGSVFAQERLEHAVDWPAWALPPRVLVEEGTELIGFYLLLRAALRLNGLARPDRPAWVPARSVLLPTFAAAALATPPLVHWLLSIPFSELSLFNRGDFASAPIVLMFFVAGALCLDRWRRGGASAAAWARVAAAFLLLSLAQHWHAVYDLRTLLPVHPPRQLWRAGEDLVWAVPVFLAVTLHARRALELRWWVAAVLVVLWAACGVAAARSGFRFAYAATWTTALVTGGWAVWATRAPAPGAGDAAAS